MLPLRSKITPIDTGTSFRREVHDLLLDVVFEDAKAIAFQKRHWAVVCVSDENVDERQIYVYTDGSTQPKLLARRVVLPIIEDGRLGRTLMCQP